MKQISILILFIFITIVTASGQVNEVAEKDTVMHGIKTKIKILGLRGSERGIVVDVKIGFQNPATGQWIWLSGTDVPLDAETGFTHSFRLEIDEDSRGKDTGFFKAIAIPETGDIFRWLCPCMQALF
ncbi:hypothetical protein [Ohtaekwangia sp.]|uniref:hypothetical protein n=1 Tax=Ohtaekwangia sp. TaxID=2066019 RepID=UPI002F92F01C